MQITSDKRNGLINKIFFNEKFSFEEKALEVWRYQYDNNTIYRRYCDLVLKNTIPVYLQDIPFLPISFFKTHHVASGTIFPEIFFESSGTTATNKSRHYVPDLKLYERSFLKNFETCYGKPEDICIIGLLPSYIEQGNSSLVYMVNDLIKRSAMPGSGFYLYHYEKLAEVLKQNDASCIPTILIGVTYALLDFFEQFPMQLKHTIIMETGGMKGRKKELLRTEVHEILKEKTGISQIHSEYGMTELFSQAYANKDGIFTAAETMQILIRPQDDPLLSRICNDLGKPISGLINIIDLSNVDSCSFIATEDSGILHPDGSFEVTGRFDNSDARGCSLMIV